jgi:hypothetical protein
MVFRAEIAAMDSPNLRFAGGAGVSPAFAAETANAAYFLLPG